MELSLAHELTASDLLNRLVHGTGLEEAFQAAVPLCRYAALPQTIGPGRTFLLENTLPAGLKVFLPKLLAGLGP